ncbi:MAG: SpoIIIAC/SpoIIIAD family protein [Christensenellales bacterium]|nr:SpoIIIAC/SpoIIIAD family protein [Christensenellales bacterium]
MVAVRIVFLCMAAAMICAMLRPQRPEVATAVSLAVGVAALILLGDGFTEIVDGIRRFSGYMVTDGEISVTVFRAAGIAVLSELGVQLCTDAGESALAGRIRLATRIVMLGMAMPMIMDAADLLQEFFG